MPTISKAFNYASNLVKQKKYDLALNEFLKITKLKPNFREAYLYIGNLYSILNKKSEAEVWFLDAKKLNEDYIVLYNLGNLYYKMGNYKKAILILEKAKKFENHSESVNLIIGLSFSRLGNVRAAEVNFKKVISINSKNRIALTALAILYYNSNKNEQSLELFNYLSKLYNENLKFKEITRILKERIGQTNIEKDNVVIGKKIYNEFIKSIATDEFSDKYGTLQTKINSLEKKDDNESLLSLSLCHLFNGEPSEAMTYLKKIKEKIV